MRTVSGLCRRGAAISLFAVLIASPILADSKATTMKPPYADPAANTASAPAETSPELETKYRRELEIKLGEETARYQGSLRSLWMSNAAVWTVLLLFIAMQALSARKRGKELERLRAAREASANRS